MKLAHDTHQFERAMTPQKALALIAEVRRLREGWRPISEAPLWETVLVYQKEAPPLTSNRSGVFSAVQVSEGKWALSGQYGRKTQAHSETLSPPPTHFMPLPTPPQDSATD